jgi:hypothetical protein
LLSIELEVERQEVRGFFIIISPVYIILSDEVVVCSFLMTTRSTAGVLAAMVSVGF